MRLKSLCRQLVAALVPAGFLALGACQRFDGPDVLVIQPSEFDAAFNSAMETARSHGMPAVFADRRSGVIETEPRVAGSVLEPWRTDHSTFGQAVESTVAYQRRRARFEFLPVGFQQQQVDETQPLQGPDLLSPEPPYDLTTLDQPLELRVWVYLENAEVPGIRRSTWTRTKSQPTRIVDPATGEVISGTSWIPVNRDRSYERRLLAEVSRDLQANDAAQP